MALNTLTKRSDIHSYSIQSLSRDGSFVSRDEVLLVYNINVNKKRMLFSTSDSSSSNVSTVSLGVSSELEFNHSWNRYDKRNQKYEVNYQKTKQTKEITIKTTTTTTKKRKNKNKKQTNEQMDGRKDERTIC